MALDTAHWQERLTALAEKRGVVGASFAIALGDETVAGATGVLNLRTKAPASTESLFQIGSITKVWTAVLAMQLVDEGLVDLDKPLVTYLPDFTVADPEVTSTVTARHLLAHTSGIDGDLFLDTGRGDDCLEKYVAAMADLKQNHPLGATMSYCNSGYILLGRLIEVVRGKTWDTVLRENLFAPLGLTSAGTLPEEALLYGAATGHVEPPGADEPAVTPQWGIYRSCGPAGLIHMTATDLLAFARLHLDGGVTKDGTRILTEASITAMQQPEVDIPDRWTLADQWGLGWFLMDWDGRKVYGHDGATLGQGGFLRILPDTGLSVALLANGGHMRELFTDLFSEVFSELAGVEMPDWPTPVDDPGELDASAYVGSYVREGVEMTVEADGSDLKATVRPTGPLAETMGEREPTVMTLRRFEGDAFVAREKADDPWTPAVFFSLPDGGRYLHFGARATPRVG
ncbi:MAG: beta-lactamase family protein [Frankiaceae bacterium]|nr:beta-lactamase family protein [Frankiaceae bacterium]